MVGDGDTAHRTDQVFGVQREVPLNYVTRDAVDGLLIESLTRDKHIVVYGSSKQGKTSMRKYNLEADDYIVVTCGHNFTLAQLLGTILKQAGYTVEQSSTLTVSGESKINARLGGGLNLGVVAVEASAGGDETLTESQETVVSSLELDPTDVNDIIRALETVDFDKFIVLEDFHYLPRETQEAFAVSLKGFHEQSPFTFIIVGVWLDANRLVQYNGDLVGRVYAVNADEWSDEELHSVIRLGEELLNVEIDGVTKDQLVAGSFDSVSIVQEACHRLCRREGIYEAQRDRCRIGAGVDVDELVKSIVDDHSARYHTFLADFADGFQETQLEMYKWILLPVLTATSEELESGITWGTLRRMIDANHPSTPVNPGNLTQSLASVASLQVKRKITPIVLDYDATKRTLDVVDRGFLIWLNYQDRAELRQTIGLPDFPVVPEGESIGVASQLPLPDA